MLLAREGAKVVVSDFGATGSHISTAELVTKEIRDLGGEAVACREDLMLANGAKATMEAAVENFGNIDILVNNAGLRSLNPIHKLTEDQWDTVVDSHLKASFLTIKHAVPIFRARGGGVIINMGSEAGLGMPFNAAYAAAKEGLAGLTRSVAREQGRFNIRCNLIRPRSIEGGQTGGADAVQKLQELWWPFIAALGPHWVGDRGLSSFGRPMPPDSIAALVAWLSTSAASNVNGRDFYVAGDEIAMFSQPQIVSTLVHDGGWSVDTLDRYGQSLIGGLTDPFRIPNPLENDD